MPKGNKLSRPMVGRSAGLHADKARRQIVAEGFDAGLRFGGRVPDEMIAVPLGPKQRWIMIASPTYLEKHPEPEHPDGLARHACIGLRTGTGALYHWELECGSEKVDLRTDWGIIVSETALAIELSEAGAGIAYCQEQRVARQLADGSLREVLPQWSSWGPSFCLYYPSRRQVPHALRALVEHLKAI